MDANKWPQNFQDVSYNTSNSNRKTIRSQEQLNCPRCNSTNTKFCYYNNYSLTQPRYFCKACRRYWTEGGSLRNVPVGGGSRKNKRSTISSSASSNPKIHKVQDGNLAFQVMHMETEHDMSHQYVEEAVLSKPETNNSMSTVSALDLLRTGIASRGLDSFIPTPMPDSSTLFSSGFPLLQDVKPGTLSFSIDLGIGNGLGSNVHHHAHGVQENGTGSHGRLFFPFGELKQLPRVSTEVDQNKGQGTATGYWNGMLGGGSW